MGGLTGCALCVAGGLVPFTSCIFVNRDDFVVSVDGGDVEC